MKIFVSAAEISSDIHAEKILKSIQKKLAEQKITIEWKGIGGPRVCALPGFTVIERAENLRTMGFIEVLKKFSFFKSLIQKTAKIIQDFQPDIILTFDYPDFHLRVMEKVKAENLAPHALRICGIPPKVWVWRSRRIEKIRNLYHGVWVIFPFEKSFYQSIGIPVIYEGNPLLEDLIKSPPSSTLKKPLETITVMPGSRDAELKYHLPAIPEALELFAKKIGKKVTAQVPVPIGVDLSLVKKGLINTEQVEYCFIENGSIQSLQETHLGLIKSGTSTLEAASLNCLPVIFYKMNIFSEQVFRFFIKAWGGYLGPVGLPNILLGIKDRKDSSFPELLGPEASPVQLSESLYQLYSDVSLRSKLLDQCSKIRSLFFLQEQEKSVAERSADKILDWYSNPPSFVRLTKKSKFGIGLVSWIWSALNWWRRRFVYWGFRSVHVVKTPSILIGNLQAGGAGKTPIVIALAREAVARGKKVAVISRGYGGTIKNPLGDEPLEIKLAVPQAIVFVGADRVKSIREAEKQKVDLILFDDGFQNLRFKAKMNLIAITERDRNQCAYRDFDSEICFADIVLGTKGSSFRHSLLKNVEQFFQIEWQWDQKIEQPVWLLCGIADPEELVSFYQERGLEIKKIIVKPDHASLDEKEVKKLVNSAREAGCILALTEKDRVKIPTIQEGIYILRRSIRNRDWMDAIFTSKLLKDESP